MEFVIRLLGSVEVTAAGRRGDLGSTKTRLALAALAWDASRTVSVDTLIHRIWDDNPPAKPKESLYAHISRIRKALEIAGGDAPAVVSRTNAYVMNVDPDRVDLRRYTSCVDQARSLKDSDDEGEAVRLLDEAAGLWRGEPLAGIAAYWAGHLRDTVAETRLAAARLRAEILMGAQKYADAVPVLLPLVEEHPVDEALVEQLALALYGSTRVAEATKLLQRTRQRVVRDIGLDAGRRLHRVHQGILQGTRIAGLLDQAGIGKRTFSPSARKIPDNLPRDIPWVGRREELRRLSAALCERSDSSAPVVTIEAIDGMGGVGKTSMAVHLAHQLRDRFPDGRIYLHLRGYVSDREPLSAAHALTELLRMLGTPPSELPQSLDELVSLWRATVRDRRMVVILDDAAGPDQVGPLLPGASPTAVIVTSRRRLPGLPGVRPVSLDVLPRDDAVALFERRLGGRGAEEEADSARIVHICGYLPLAIELVASRLLTRPSWTTSDLLRQLSDGSGGLSEMRDGERTLTHVFALSYRALTPLQRLVFRRIGLHFGLEFGPHAVAALTGLSLETTERALEQLLAHHFISEPSPHRFTMHDLLREYARTLTEDEDEDAEAEVADDANADPGVKTHDDSGQALRRLVDHYVRVADRADRLAYPFRSRIAVEAGDLSVTPWPEMRDAHEAERWLIAEGANLLAALDWIRHFGTECQLALCVNVLVGFLDVEGHLVVSEPLLRRAVAHWRAVGDDAARARALLDLAEVCIRCGRYEEGHSTANEALDIARSLRDSELESQSIHQLSIPLWHTAQYALARILQERSLSLRLQLGGRLHVARSYNLLGITHLHLGENEKAMEYFRHALSDFTRLAHHKGRYSVLNNIGELHQKVASYQAAERAYREAIEISKIMGSRVDRATLHMNFASVLTALGKADEALVLYGDILPALRSVGDVRAEGLALNGIGRAYRVAGRSERALPEHIAALAVMRRIHAEGEVAEVLYDLALAEQNTGRLGQAATHLEESLSISRRTGARSEEDRAVRALARLRQERGHVG